jgi:hypothetical protein
MRRVLADPLAHFVLAGAVLFFVGSRLAPVNTDEASVVVPTSRVLSMVEAFESREGRPPRDEEVDRIIELIADSEILRREAKRLGFDESDPIIQRRLGQKMRFVLEEEADAIMPSDADLQAHLDENAERYRRAEKLSFVHVFSGGKDADQNAFADMGAKLKGGAEPLGLGDPFNLGQRFRQRERDELARQLGREFADALFSLTPGQWARVESRFGLHWVRVEESIEARPARLEEVRSQVVESLKRERREAAVLRGVEELREHYTIEAPSRAELRAARGEGG